MSNKNDNANNDSHTLNRWSQRSNRGIPPDRFSFLTNNIVIEPKCWDDIEKNEKPY